MPTVRLLLPISLLISCEGAPKDGVFTVPSGPSTTSLGAVQARIAASARTIVPEGKDFVAPIPAHHVVARFSEDGLVLGEPGAENPLHLSFLSWGMVGAEREVDLVEPSLGACLTELLPEGDCARQLEYAYEGLTAWWVGLDRGVEFGWTIAAPPKVSDGELSFTMEVQGADWLEAVGDGAELVDSEGVTWTISEALAWGADGTPLPAWLEVEGDRLVVRVDARGAVYPVNVDPVLSVASSTLTGNSGGELFGYSVANAGDVNGDGYADVIIGAPGHGSGSSNYVGRAYVFHGSSSGFSSSANLTLTGSTAFDYLGWSVSGAGDVNGDGYADVLVGAFGYDSGSLVDAGRVYIHHGSASGVAAGATRTLTGAWTGDAFGRALGSAGDVNGDGYDDVIIGAPGVDNGALGNAGATYIHHGSPSGIFASASRTLMGNSGSEYFGWSVSGAGDVNGDGFDDVIIGSEAYDSGALVDAGSAVIHHGSLVGVSVSASRTLLGDAPSLHFGWSVAGAGDVNGDGFEDVIIGAYGAGNEAGAAFIHHGSSAGLSSSANTTLTGDVMGDHFGISVDSAGDVNGDGYSDIIVGAHEFDSAGLGNVGVAYVHHGSSGGVSAGVSRTLVGAAALDYLGIAVAGAGDINGDGFDDIIVGAPYSDAGGLSDAGRAYAHLGYQDEDGDGVIFGGEVGSPQDCDDWDPSVGAPATRYVDADGDGFGGAVSVVACPNASGTSALPGDCDDTRIDVNPGAAERCDVENVDEDCDGLADDLDALTDPATLNTFYLDADHDGFGAADDGVAACDPPTGHVTDNTDCDDAQAGVNPSAPEWCDVDNTDENCDGAADDEDPAVEPDSYSTFYADTDGDGFAIWPPRLPHATSPTPMSLTIPTATTPARR